MLEIPSHRITPSVVNQLSQNDIFVFGSNISGNHSAGAARTALRWGAVMGQGVGHHGCTYAIPTMFKSTRAIVPYVNDFVDYTRANPHLRFLVTEIGCGIAGFEPKDIAPLFENTIDEDNVLLPERFWDILCC